MFYRLFPILVAISLIQVAVGADKPFVISIGPSNFRSYPAKQEWSSVCVSQKGKILTSSAKDCKAIFCEKLSELGNVTGLGNGQLIMRCVTTESLEIEFAPELDSTAPNPNPTSSASQDEDRERLLTELLRSDPPANIDLHRSNPSVSQDSAKTEQYFDRYHPFSLSKERISFLFKRQDGGFDVARSHQEVAARVSPLKSTEQLFEYLTVFHGFLIHAEQTETHKERGGFRLSKVFQGSVNCGYFTVDLYVTEAGAISVIKHSQKSVQPAMVSDC